MRRLVRCCNLGLDMALAMVARHQRIKRGDRKQAQTYTNDTVQADTFCSAANMAITQLDKSGPETVRALKRGSRRETQTGPRPAAKRK
jgi:hypothetical protein